MKKLMVIDACMRDEASRTRRILGPIVAELGKRYEIETVSLDGEDYQSVGRKVLAIAAPFWDMSFPAILKVFIENMSLFNITFRDNGTDFEGLCRSEKVLYITTRGMNVHTGDALDAATPYMKALSSLWGWGEVTTVAAENLDYSTPEEIDRKIEAAIAEGLEICKDF